MRFLRNFVFSIPIEHTRDFTELLSITYASFRNLLKQLESIQMRMLEKVRLIT